MDPLQITLRLLHIVLGSIWVGAVVFTTYWLGPAVAEVGPDGGKVMAALQRRGLMNFLPLVAVLTIISGLWMFGQSTATVGAAWVHSPFGMALSVGALVAIVAFILGILVMRPAMLRAGSLMQGMAALASDAERSARMTEIQALRASGASIGRIVAVLLLIATAAMAVARYL